MLQKEEARIPWSDRLPPGRVWPPAYEDARPARPTARVVLPGCSRPRTVRVQQQAGRAGASGRVLPVGCAGRAGASGRVCQGRVSSCSNVLGLSGVVHGQRRSGVIGPVLILGVLHCRNVRVVFLGCGRSGRLARG